MLDQDLVIEFPVVDRLIFQGPKDEVNGSTEECLKLSIFAVSPF